MKRVLCCLLVMVFCMMCCVIPVSAVETTMDETGLTENHPMSGIYGDADCDGDVTSIDCTIMLRRICQMKLPSTTSYEDFYYWFVADVDNDGFVTVIDVTQIQRYLVGIRTKGCVASAERTFIRKDGSIADYFYGNNEGFLKYDFYGLRIYVAMKQRGYTDSEITSYLCYLDEHSMLRFTTVVDDIMAGIAHGNVVLNKSSYYHETWWWLVHENYCWHIDDYYFFGY